ncbi:MAG TPA: PP2C family serine/threonine-protein phosphatase, partial [Polyangium sp.]|nr:PP2C family serine/threonine-protein phosphatase [Polyangium sp.]
MSRGDAPWRVVRVSVTGTSHHAQKLPCQDASYDAVRDDFCVVAVADGVGSARYSEVGAKTAVESATTFLVEHYVPNLDKIGWRQLMQEAATHALEEIRLISTKREHELRSYASTLLLAVVDRQRVVAFHVGDGAIVALVDDKLVALTVPQKGEFANEVFPLTKPGAIDNAQFHYGDRSPNALALFTDGIESLAMDMATRVPHERFFLPIFERARDVQSDKLREEIRLLFEQKAAQRSDDDMTLAIVVPEKPRARTAEDNREIRAPKPDRADEPSSNTAPPSRKDVEHRLPPPIRSDRGAPLRHVMVPVGRRRDDPEDGLVPLGIPRTNLPVPNRVNRILAALSGLFIVEHIVIFMLWSYDVFNIGPPAIPTAKSATVTHPGPTAQPQPKSLPEKPPP